MLCQEIVNALAGTDTDVILILGKSCTGKSTLAHRLRELRNDEIISLDDHVFDAVIRPLHLEDLGDVFIEVYRYDRRLDWIDPFIESVTSAVSSLVHSGRRVLIEGALANPLTTKRLINVWPRTAFVYLHPQDLDAYVSNITARFMTATTEFNANLPTAFWNLVEEGEFELFCSTRSLTNSLRASIDAYAHASQKESLERLARFSDTFEAITVVDV